MLPNPCDTCERQGNNCVNAKCPAWKYYFRVNWAAVCRPFRRMAEWKAEVNKR